MKITIYSWSTKGYRAWDRLDKSGNVNGHVVYHKETNTLVAYDADGVPKTMNRPSGPRSDKNPNGWPSQFKTLEEYLSAQGQRER
ncbi:hypothetical protein V1460_04095 [Streptomyces sp. SCSIO 30461]|uniref:hypothetical protein n=1 Tax=Streptomyces sp. SCSIO 30461 TaxID=3118085 RepID=UPI0030CEC9ED